MGHALSRSCRLLMAFLLSFLVNSIYSQTIIKTIPAPDYPYGLTFDGSHLWVGTSSTNDDVVWQLDPADGSVTATIPVPFVPPSGSYTVKGLAHDGENLWVFMDLPTANHPDKFYKVDPADGTVLKTLDSPENNYIGGMSFIDGDIWYTQYFANADDGKDVIIRMDTTGVTRDTIISVGEQPMGLAYDGGFMWCAEDTGFGSTRQEIYEYDLINGTYTGTFIDNPTASPRDMTFDGQYFWIVDYNNTKSLLYQFDSGGDGTPAIEFPQTSLQFGLTEIGQPKEIGLTIVNQGDATLSISAATFTNDDYSSDFDALPFQIPAGESHTAQVTFTPGGFGEVDASLTIVSNDPVNPASVVGLSGKGMYGSPTIALTASSHNFGEVWIAEEGVANWTLGLINQSIVDLEISAVTNSDSAFTTDLFSPQSIAADDTLHITVFFDPPAPGSYAGSMDIFSNDPDHSPLSVALAGEGSNGPFSIGYRFWHYQVPDNPATSFQEYRVEALKYIDDVTGDGNADVIIASENYWTICLDGNSSGLAAEVWRFSSYISQWSAGSIGSTNASPHQQKALAVANDLNGDSVQDVVIGTGGGNEHVYALSGLDGSTIWEFGTDDPDSFSLGDITSVEVLNDFNNDGIHDVVASASAADLYSGRRSVYCLSGTDGSEVWHYTVGSFIRHTVAIGDVNANGTVDVVTATGDGLQNAYVIAAIESEGSGGFANLIWSFDIGSASGGGKELHRYHVPGETADVIAGGFFGILYRLDGETGEVIWTFDPGFSAANEINMIDDLSGDGLNEVLYSSFEDRFYVLSGADGSIVWSKLLGNFSWSGQAISDLNGDFVPDVLVACRNDNLYALSGTDGSTLLEYAMGSGELQGATIVFPMPDMDNNISSEILGAADGGQIVALSGGGDATVRIDPRTSGEIPAEFALDQNYPNPFNPETDFRFGIADFGWVEIHIFDVQGRLIKTVVSEQMGPGNYTASWDGSDAQGNAVSSGVYFYRLTVAGRFNPQSSVRKMILLR